jgi:hypothetical protein
VKATSWRRKIQKEIGPVPDVVWDRIITDVTMDYIKEATRIESEDGPREGLEWLIEAVKRELDSYEHYMARLSEPPPGQKESDERPAGTESPPRAVPAGKPFQALSRIIAALANREQAIKDFRQEVLGGRLLTPEEVPQWIKSMSETEGLSLQIAFTVLQAPGWEDEVVKQAEAWAAARKQGKTYPASASRETLSYVVPDSECRSTATINKRGILGRLKRLAAQYEAFWPEAWAVYFILTGEAYPVSYATVGRSLNPFGTGKITLTVSPHITGDKVKGYFLEEKKRYLNETIGQAKSRQLSDKHLALAVFAAENPVAYSWPGMMKEWNKQNPKWKYKHSFNFARDCRRAYRNLTGWEL